ncbi:MAG: hypothetical protein AAGC79_10170 [Pseudomonadota bacterium]
MARRDVHPLDPRDLIAEAYRIEGIGPEDCRSIFFDWALGLDAAENPVTAAQTLLAHHQPDAEHPMTVLLREAAEGEARPRRRRART